MIPTLFLALLAINLATVLAVCAAASEEVFGQSWVSTERAPCERGAETGFHFDYPNQGGAGQQRQSASEPGGLSLSRDSLALNQESGCRLAEGPRSVKTVCYSGEDNRQVTSPTILSPDREALIKASVSREKHSANVTLPRRVKALCAAAIRSLTKAPLALLGTWAGTLLNASGQRGSKSLASNTSRPDFRRECTPALRRKLMCAIAENLTVENRDSEASKMSHGQAEISGKNTNLRIAKRDGVSYPVAVTRSLKKTPSSLSHQHSIGMHFSHSLSALPTINADVANHEPGLGHGLSLGGLLLMNATLTKI